MFMLIGSWCGFTLLASIFAFKLGRNTVKWEIEEKEEQKLLEAKKVIDPIVEHLLIGLSTGLWKRRNSTSDKAVCWGHTKTKHLFTLEKTQNSGIFYEPMIYCYPVNGNIERIHSFSTEEVRIVEKAIKDKELELLADANIGSELN